MHDGKGVNLSESGRSSSKDGSHDSGVRLLSTLYSLRAADLWRVRSDSYSMCLNSFSSLCRCSCLKAAGQMLANLQPLSWETHRVWHANSGRLLRISPIPFLSYQSDHFRLGRCWITAHQSSVSSFHVERGRCGCWELLSGCSFVSHQQQHGFLEKRFFGWRHCCCHPPLLLFQWFQSREHGCDWRAEHLFTTTPSNLDPTPASPPALCAPAHTWTKIVAAHPHSLCVQFSRLWPCQCDCRVKMGPFQSKSSATWIWQPHCFQLEEYCKTCSMFEWRFSSYASWVCN